MLETHRELIDLLMTAMVPLGRHDDYYAIAVEPFGTVPFYESPGWKRLELGEGERFHKHMNIAPEQLLFGKLMWAYEFLLEEWAGVEADLQHAIVMTVHDEEVGLDRHFSLHIDPQFISVRLVRDIEKPSSEVIARLLAEPTNLDLWTEVLPHDAFEFDGITVITAVDVTPHEVMSRLKNDLIERDSMASPEKVDSPPTSPPESARSSRY